MRLKSIIKKSYKMIVFAPSFFLGLIFYRKILSHTDFRRFDSSGWERIRKCWFAQKIMGKNRYAIWPVSPLSRIGEPRNLIIDQTSEGCLMSTGLYIQCMDAKTIIGKNVYIAPNVGIITANHDVCDLQKHSPGKDVVIGDDCWLGMNSVILPGVVLGNKTIVGAGSIVTKSFPEGHYVIAGNPAKVIKLIDRKDTIE